MIFFYYFSHLLKRFWTWWYKDLIVALDDFKHQNNYNCIIGIWIYFFHSKIPRNNLISDNKTKRNSKGLFKIWNWNWKWKCFAYIWRHYKYHPQVLVSWTTETFCHSFYTTYWTTTEEYCWIWYSKYVLL